MNFLQEIFLPNPYLKKEEIIDHKKLDRKNFINENNSSHYKFISSSEETIIDSDESSYNETSTDNNETSTDNNETSTDNFETSTDNFETSSDNNETSISELTDSKANVRISDLLDTIYDIEGGKGKKGKKKKAKKKKAKKKSKKKSKKKESESEAPENEEKEEVEKEDKEDKEEKEEKEEVEKDGSAVFVSQDKVSVKATGKFPILPKNALIQQLKNLAALDPTLEIQIVTEDDINKKYLKNTSSEEIKEDNKYPIFYKGIKNFI